MARSDMIHGAAFLRVTIAATSETDGRDAFILNEENLAIHLNPGDERLCEIKHDSNTGKTTSIARGSVVIDLDDIADSVADGFDHIRVVIPGRKVGQTDPSDNARDEVVAGVKGGSPWLNGEAMAKNYPRAIHQGTLKVIFKAEFDKKTVLIKVNELERAGRCPETLKART